MGLIQLIIIFLIVGAGMALLKYAPLPEPFPQVIKILVLLVLAIAIVLFLAGLAGYATPMPLRLK